MDEPAAAAAGRRVASMTPTGAREAREMLRELLSSWGWRGDIEAAVLAMSEIATNALVHAGGIGTVTVEMTGALLTVSTSDGGTPLPTARPLETTAASGRGLQIVAQVADAWGVELEKHGKSVWFEMRPR